MNRVQKIPMRWSLFDAQLPTPLTPYEQSKVHRLFRHTPSQFITSVNDAVSQCPEWQVPEVAFAGRSNVGKSSLINRLCHATDLVRTSKTPGRTQQLNYFSIGGKRGSEPDLAIVDMPGYGYAQANTAEVRRWNTLMGSYCRLRRHENLKKLFLLLDARRGITPVDHEFMAFLHQLDMPFQIIMTKVDAVPVKELEERVKKVSATIHLHKNICMHPVVHMVSSRVDYGISAIREEIALAAGHVVGPVPSCPISP